MLREVLEVMQAGGHELRAFIVGGTKLRICGRTQTWLGSLFLLTPILRPASSQAFFGALVAGEPPVARTAGRGGAAALKSPTWTTHETASPGPPRSPQSLPGLPSPAGQALRSLKRPRATSRLREPQMAACPASPSGL